MATIEIDLDEYIDEISTADLRDELARRCDDGEELDSVLERGLNDIRDALLRNKPAEALCILDTILFPKWRSEAQCQAEYDRAMGKKKAA